MKFNAAVLRSSDSQPKYEFVEIEKNEHELFYPVLASALNHRDLWIIKGKYAGIKYPIILGSDAVVESEGKKYVISPCKYWGSNEFYQGKDFIIRGLPEHGSFAEYIALIKSEMKLKPSFLSDIEAASFGLAGLTAYRALFAKAKIKQSDKVFISGIGGGVALMAMQFALANGNNVFVSSSSNSKLEKAKSLGASAVFNYTEEKYYKNVLKEVGKIDVVIDSAGGAGFSNLISICDMGARIVMYGGTAGMAYFSPQKLFWNQINIMGTSMGSQRDFDNMWSFIEDHQIKPIIDSTFSLQKINKGLERMDKGVQFGKIVLDHSL